MRWILSFALVCLSLVAACSADKPATVDRQETAGGESTGSSNMQPPSIPAGAGRISLSIEPGEPSRKSTLSLQPEGFILADALIKWYVNGYEIESGHSREFNAADTRKGDKIQAKAIIKDKEILSNAVLVKNALPEVTKARLVPEASKTGNVLRVDVEGSDADGDEVTIASEWTRNGEPAGEGRTIGVPLKRGDRVSVKLVPFDQAEYGVPVVIDREIKNLPPSIIDEKKMTFTGDVCTYKISGTDPDGDPLTFSLKEAPEGMTIDPSTGLITWNVPSGFKGNAGFTACVEDGQGGKSEQSFTIDIVGK